MATIEAAVERRDGLALTDNTKIILLAEAPNHQGMDAVGFFSYNKKADGFATRKQYFQMEVNGALHSVAEHKEIDLIVSLGSYLERKFKECGVTVFEVHLPKTHGYSGNTYGYATTLRLFPHAGIPKKKLTA
ncbi:hypothetical protein [Streptomyces sp. CHB9.2]|uniref:hypothetical protein n=1 Tax=Streptomyces sp. CHB9.2 TaxID=2841670 RepID=UPI0020964495|nr:hypothetical protein [Streptomyces sp. CHB9.2]MCO6704793.1 hypothetical protein [Streptomyces sp. CHB9.2]